MNHIDLQVARPGNINTYADLIRYSRGEMEILDADGLAAGACACYWLIETQIDRMFDHSWQDLIEGKDQHS